MNRLLQGEVGSGKTLVALRAMLRVVDSGGQAALLAPTEVRSRGRCEPCLDALPSSRSCFDDLFRQGPAFALPLHPERALPSRVRLWEPGAYDSARSRHCNKEDT